MVFKQTFYMFFDVSRKISNQVLSSMAAYISVTSPTAESIGIQYLKSGCVIAVPTDTVYGLACDATNKTAINSLYNIKCRNENKPLAICLSEVGDVKTWAHVEHLPIKLLHSLLPGPITLILCCANNSLDSSLSLKGKVGIRVPDYRFIQNLSSGLGKPLALTSANLSNEPSAVEVVGFSNIWDKLPAIFDGGKLKANNSASTVVDLSEPGSFHIVRNGVACEEIINTLINFNLKNKYPVKSQLTV